MSTYHSTTYSQTAHHKDSNTSKMELMRRIGYGGKGFLYAALGGLVAGSVIASHSQSMGFRETIAWLADQPFGLVLVALMGAALACYAVYRFACGFTDYEREGDDKAGIGKRIGFVASGLAYASLAIFAGSLLVSGNSSDGKKDDMIAQLSSSTWGAVVLWLVAAGLAIAACHQFYRAWSGKFRDRFDWSELPSGTKKFVKFSAIFGLNARAVVFGLIAFLIGTAAAGAGSTDGGIEDAFSWLSGSTFASVSIAAVVALGFIGYGIYAVAIAWCGRRYRG